MSGSATPVIAHIVETMRVKIITSETNVGRRAAPREARVQTSEGMKSGLRWRRCKTLLLRDRSA